MAAALEIAQKAALRLLMLAAVRQQQPAGEAVAAAAHFVDYAAGSASDRSGSGLTKNTGDVANLSIFKVQEDTRPRKPRDFSSRIRERDTRKFYKFQKK